MSIIAQTAYPVLSVSDFVAWLDGSRSFQSPAILLTFDDGYRDQLENAVPVLEAHGFPAVFFIVSGYVGRHAAWCEEFSSRCVPALPLMDDRELIELSRSGYAVGAQTQTHPRLSRLPPHEVEREVAGTRLALEDLLGREVDLFCYPYGDYDSVATRVVREAGFKLAFTVERGFVRRGDDPYLLRRVAVLGEPQGSEFRAYLSGVILDYWNVRNQLPASGGSASFLSAQSRRRNG